MDNSLLEFYKNKLQTSKKKDIKFKYNENVYNFYKKHIQGYRLNTTEKMYKIKKKTKIKNLKFRFFDKSLDKHFYERSFDYITELKKKLKSKNTKKTKHFLNKTINFNKIIKHKNKIYNKLTIRCSKVINKDKFKLHRNIRKYIWKYKESKEKIWNKKNFNFFKK